eukprot:6199090-Pleurochrysis_carterae.AAC.1
MLTFTAACAGMRGTQPRTHHTRNHSTQSFKVGMPRPLSCAPVRTPVDLVLLPSVLIPDDLHSSLFVPLPEHQLSAYTWRLALMLVERRRGRLQRRSWCCACRQRACLNATLRVRACVSGHVALGARQHRDGGAGGARGDAGAAAG